MQIETTTRRHLDLDTLVLRYGAHSSPDEGMCLLEAVAYLAGEEHSDSPRCACPVLAAYGRAFNDLLGEGAEADEKRTRLLGGFAERLVGTRSTHDVELARSFLAMDWIIRTYTPAWLALMPALEPHAKALRELPPIDSVAALESAQPTLRAAQEASAAASAAAWDAAWDAAWAAAWDAARDAASAAAWDAAWDAASAAAWDAAWAAARAAASAKLRPVVDALQASAVELFERMLTVTPESLR